MKEVSSSSSSSSSSSGSTVFARLPIFARPFHRELYERASAFWRRVLFTSDAENVYPGCMRLKGCMR